MFWKNSNIEKKDWLTPVSIIIGSIIISVSIFLTAGGYALTGSKTVGDTQGSKTITTRKDAATEGKGKVSVVVYSDFQCPYCKSFFENAYKEIKTKYIDTNKIKLTFRHFPLSFHVNSQKAAEAAECANKQDKFFEYHDLLFTKGQSDGTGLDTASLKQYAKDLGLNTEKFNQCLDNGETTAIVKQDIEDASKEGVTGTPTILINGKKIIGAQPFENFETEIEAALK